MGYIVFSEPADSDSVAHHYPDKIQTSLLKGRRDRARESLPIRVEC